jgi:TolB-like protein/Tfp pilus assembly protein PilF
MSFFSELKRRNVFRVAVAYLALAWLLTEVAGTLFPAFGIPDWGVRFLVIVFALGFIPALVISWVYELTPEGIMREKDVVRDVSVAHTTAKRLDIFTIGMVVVAFAFVLFDRLWLNPRLESKSARADAIVTESMQTAAPDPVERQFPASSIAVLPFANRSANPDDAYFVDGIHDNLLTYISQIGSIKTISRTSVMRYRDSTQSIPEIARELEVATVLEGSVQRAGEQVRINVQLIDARTDDHLWAQIYDRQLTATDIFSIQSEIAGAIAEALRAELTPEALDRITNVPTKNLEALEAYFLGRQSMATRTISDLARAAGYFEEAVALDNGFALAWVGLADAYQLQWAYSPYELDKDEMFAKSRAAVEQSLRLDPGLGAAYASVGKRKNHEGDPIGAETAFKQALQLNPNYAPAYQWYGELLRNLVGRIDEAIELYRKAATLDPKSAVIMNDYGYALRRAGRFEDAVIRYRQAVEIEPRFAKGYRSIGYLLAMILGRLDEAVAPLQKSFLIEPDSWSTPNTLGSVYFELGDLEQAKYWRDRSLERAPETIAPDIVVALHHYQGEDEAALAYARKDLKSDPRYLPPLRLVRDHEISAGNFEAARGLFEHAFPELFVDSGLQVDQGNREAAVDLAYLLLQAGERPRAESLLDHSQAAIDLGRYSGVEGFDVLEARIHAVRGDRESALAALRQAVDQGWRWYAWYFLKFDPVLASLHEEPEFRDIVQYVKADLAAQRTRLQEREIRGELPYKFEGSE